MTIPAWIDDVMPYKGPCGLCGGDDARHRVLDAMVERVRAGDSVRSVAEDYDYPREFVARVAAEWIVETVEEPPESPIPEGWIEIAFLPRPKYVVIEEDDGWHAYSEDDHGAYS